MTQIVSNDSSESKLWTIIQSIGVLILVIVLVLSGIGISVLVDAYSNPVHELTGSQRQHYFQRTMQYITIAPNHYASLPNTLPQDHASNWKDQLKHIRENIRIRQEHSSFVHYNQRVTCVHTGLPTLQDVE